MKILYILVAILAILILLGWIGLNIRPKSFVIPARPQTDPKTIPIPSGLPAPVERFYRTVYGDQIPVIETAVFVGRGRIRPFGIWLPARFVFVHNAGKITVTISKLPFLDCLS